MAKPIPDEYRRITPYLYFNNNAGPALEFYKDVFGATERMRIPGPDDTVGHAELQIGDSVLMIADLPDRSPQSLKGTAVSFVLYVEDVDAAFKRALDAGAKSIQEPENKFYGDRMGTLADPFGHEWSLGTHVEDVSPDEMQRRAESAANTTA